jgi:hypothetical protein
VSYGPARRDCRFAYLPSFLFSEEGTVRMVRMVRGRFKRRPWSRDQECERCGLCHPRQSAQSAVRVGHLPDARSHGPHVVEPRHNGPHGESRCSLEFRRHADHEDRADRAPKSSPCARRRVGRASDGSPLERRIATKTVSPTSCSGRESADSCCVARTRANRRGLRIGRAPRHDRRLCWGDRRRFDEASAGRIPDVTGRSRIPRAAA